MKTLFTEGLECLQSTLSCTSIKNPLRPLTLLKLISKQINKQKMDHWKNIPYFRLSPCFRTLRKNHNRCSVLQKKRYSFARRFDTKTFVLTPFKQTTGTGGGGTTIYGLYRYVPLWRVWFSNRSLLWDRVYKSESLGLEYGIIFQEADQLFEDFSLD